MFFQHNCLDFISQVLKLFLDPSSFFRKPPPPEGEALTQLVQPDHPRNGKWVSVRAWRKAAAEQSDPPPRLVIAPNTNQNRCVFCLASPTVALRATGSAGSYRNAKTWPLKKPVCIDSEKGQGVVFFYIIITTPTLNRRSFEIGPQNKIKSIHVRSISAGWHF